MHSPSRARWPKAGASFFTLCARSGILALRMQKIPLSRTRFGEDIVAEFLAPNYDSSKVAIITAGAPGYPGKKEDLMQVLARRGYWSIVPRYRGTWESAGTFLEYPPSEDVKIIMDQVSKGFEDLWAGTTHCVREPEFLLLGGSFGGPAAVLNSADARVKKAVAISSVVDWRLQEHTVEPLQVMSEYVPQSYGMAYRAEPAVWEKLSQGNFYNPIDDKQAVEGKKLLFIHAKDDVVVHAAPAEAFAKETGAQFVMLRDGGHMGVGVAHEPHIWRYIEKFLKNK